MVIKNSRAQRRHDRARLKEKRQYHWGYGHKGTWCGRTASRSGEINYMAPRIAGSVVDTPTPCSCWMCGNPRRTGTNDNPLTMQEQKALLAFEDQVIDYFDWEDCFYVGYFNLYDYDVFEEDPADDWYLRWMYIK